MSEKNTTLTDGFIISLANLNGIDTDIDGDIFGSTNGALLEFSRALLAHSAPASNAQDTADAKRYRELRDCNSGSLVIVEITGIGEDDWHVLTEDDADKAIDAAISAKESEHG